MAYLLVWLILLIPSFDDPPRKPSPFAPSLPLLTDEEEAAYDEIVNRFIDADSGQLTGEPGKKARRDFERLGPDATFALIRGLNRAAKIEHSCPALVIARRLARILNTTDDKELLDYARENIGADVTSPRHADTLRDLRLLCTFRKNKVGTGLARTTPAPTPRSFPSLTVAELAEAATSQTGTRLKLTLMELSHRPGEEALTALATAATLAYEEEPKRLARDFLDRALTRRSDAVLKGKLSDKRAEMRAAATRVVAARHLPWGAELIERLDDEYEEVRVAAHQGLVRLAGGSLDFGPEPKADEAARGEAVKQWKAWWQKQR